jgi:hypothetical protein
MKIGTKSVLFGAHCFFLHPWFVAWGWWKLYGFPWDPRLWVAFFVHDLGYWGKPNMDGPEGETHPRFGARVMGRLFDNRLKPRDECPTDGEFIYRIRDTTWHDFSLLHSRYYAKKLGFPVSPLCYADKLSIALTTAWLYLPMVRWTGEIDEYLKNAKNADKAGHFKADDYRGREKLWHAELVRYMVAWVEAHKDGSADTWTNHDRHAITDSGVWK